MSLKRSTKAWGEELQGQAGGTTEGEGADKQQLVGLLHPVQLSGAVVEADDGLGALGNTLEQQEEDLQHAGADGHGAHGGIAAVGLQRGVEGHVYQALGGVHDKGRHAKGHHRGQHLGIDAEVAPLEAQLGALAGEEPER